MNKKAYFAPKANLIEVYAELPLAMSGNMNQTGLDNVEFESNAKDWSSEIWGTDEE